LWYNKMYWKWCSFMFPYGVYRGWNCEKHNWNTLITQRLVYSICNGVTYCTPLGIYQLYMQLNRLDIAYHKLNKKDYSYCYEEFYGTNYNTV